MQLNGSKLKATSKANIKSYLKWFLDVVNSLKIGCPVHFCHNNAVEQIHDVQNHFVNHTNSPINFF